MHIARVVIDNLRAIDHWEESFADKSGEPRRRVVIAGANGSGKTTLLEAIAHIYSQHSLRNERSQFLFDASDLHSTATPTEAAISGQQRGGGVAVEGVLSERQMEVLHRFKSRIPNYGYDPTQRGWMSEMVTQSVGRFPSDAERKNTVVNLPNRGGAFDVGASRVMNIVLLPTQRGGLAIRKDLTLEQMQIEWSSIDPDPARFARLPVRLALGWMSPEHNDSNGRLARLWQVVEKYFPELPRPVRVDGLHLLFETRDGSVVRLDKLSAGERALLLVLAEVAVRNPEDGVILIDEIEQHLHPRWQVAILEAIPALIPTAQLIVTTQSSYVVAAAPDDVIKIGDWGKYEP